MTLENQREIKKWVDFLQLDAMGNIMWGDYESWENRGAECRSLMLQRILLTHNGSSIR